MEKNELFENDDKDGLSKLVTGAAMWCAEKPIYWTELNRKALELVITGGTIDIFNNDDDKSNWRTSNRVYIELWLIDEQQTWTLRERFFHFNNLGNLILFTYVL